MALIAEAMACASKGGVSLHALMDCLAKGGGGVALEPLRPYVLRGETEQLKFSINNAAKDIGYYRQMTFDLGAAGNIAEEFPRFSKPSQRKSTKTFLPQAARLIGTEQ